MSCDNNLHNISDIISDELEVKSSQDCNKRKRHQTDESVNDGGDDIIISLYKADCFVFIGEGNQSIRRKPPTCQKSLTNFIT
jgi:hypothetical protein